MQTFPATSFFHIPFWAQSRVFFHSQRKQKAKPFFLGVALAKKKKKKKKKGGGGRRGISFVSVKDVFFFSFAQARALAPFLLKLLQRA